MKINRFARWGMIAIAGLIIGAYVVISVGLFALERMVDRKRGAEAALEASSREPHKIVLYDNGTASLERRLQLIQSAKKSIELEFFIFDIDQSSRLFVNALLKKAAAGVKVRVLVDFSSTVFELKPAFAKMLKDHGVEVRYYNTASLYRLVSSQHRSHRKLLLIDGETVFTGGRNIANDYFDLAKDRNFLDSDIELSGPIVAKIRDGYDVYWKSDAAQLPETIEEKISEKQYKKAEDIFLEKDDDMKMVAGLAARTKELIMKKQEFTCTDITYVTDYPNAGEKNRKVYPAIVEALKRARKEIVAESPYFVINSGGMDALNALHVANVRLTVLTNSLRSTDADYAVAALHWRLSSVARTGAEVFAFTGDFIPDQSNRAAAGNEIIWGVHSKRAVIDGRDTLIGTYNLDPRSANLNSELLVICRDNPALAAAVLSSMKLRIEHSLRVVGADGSIESANLTQNPTWLARIRYWLVFPVANLFAFLL